MCDQYNLQLYICIYSYIVKYTFDLFQWLWLNFTSIMPVPSVRPPLPRIRPHAPQSRAVAPLPKPPDVAHLLRGCAGATHEWRRWVTKNRKNLRIDIDIPNLLWILFCIQYFWWTFHLLVYSLCLLGAGGKTSTKGPYSDGQQEPKQLTVVLDFRWVPTLSNWWICLVVVPLEKSSKWSTRELGKHYAMKAVVSWVKLHHTRSGSIERYWKHWTMILCIDCSS